MTFGTEGDSRPLIALCRGLRDVGNDVLLLGERSGREHSAEADATPACARARVIGEAMATEHGVVAAVARIESWVGSARRN